MKRIILLATTFSTIFILGQSNKVGINTDNPERTLDINGNLRIRKLTDKSDNAKYSDVLIANSTGDVDHVLRNDFLPVPSEFDSRKEIYSSIYNNTTNDPISSKIVTCGEFVFLFNRIPGDGRIHVQFKLTNKPDSTVYIYGSIEQNWHTDGFEFFQGNTHEDVNIGKPYVFTTTNYNTSINFAGSNIADYEQNTIFLQYPNMKSFYRLLIYKVKQTSSWDFITTCEKF